MSMSVSKLIGQLLTQAVEKTQAKGLFPEGSLPEVVVEKPQNLEHGDFATAVPLKLARVVGQQPMDIAKKLVKEISSSAVIEKVWVASPGFINIAIKDSWLSNQVQEILDANGKYGDSDLGLEKKVQIEFVSANPTGPLHVGHGRGAVLGSTLSNILSAAGYSVTREYYVNDSGSQIDAFVSSLYARYKQVLGQDVDMPPGSYMGEYMIDLANQVVEDVGGKLLAIPETEALGKLKDIGLGKVLDGIKTDLSDLKVDFDEWFAESELYVSGQYKETMAKLEANGYVAIKDGATWFVSTALGEDKDNVLVRSTGTPTYFASDTAYHYNKLGVRNFDKVIDIWGADHKGHVSRIHAAMSALGLDPDKIHILISQLVTLKRDGEVVRLSKRTGDTISLRDVIDEVGADACRYFFLARGYDSQMEFDLELAKERSQENPVYYIQYAHARISGILRNAEELGIEFSDGDVASLTDKAELGLVKQLIALPDLVEAMAQSLEPHHLPHYALDLATSFHWFYDQCRVITDDSSVTKSRLKLVEASRIVLAKVLQMMGMKAPEKM